MTHLRPIVLFEKHGMDTLEISKLTGASEAEVYNSLHFDRTQRMLQAKGSGNRSEGTPCTA